MLVIPVNEIVFNYNFCYTHLMSKLKLSILIGLQLFSGSVATRDTCLNYELPYGSQHESQNSSIQVFGIGAPEPNSQMTLVSLNRLISKNKDRIDQLKEKLENPKVKKATKRLDKLNNSKNKISKRQKEITSAIEKITDIVCHINKLNANPGQNKHTKELKKLLKTKKKPTREEFIQMTETILVELSGLSFEDNDLTESQTLSQKRDKAIKVLGDKLNELTEKEKKNLADIAKLEPQILPIKKEIERREKLSSKLSESEEKSSNVLLNFQTASNRHMVAIQDLELYDGQIRENPDKFFKNRKNPNKLFILEENGNPLLKNRDKNFKKLRENASKLEKIILGNFEDLSEIQTDSIICKFISSVMMTYKSLDEYSQNIEQKANLIKQFI